MVNNMFDLENSLRRLKAKYPLFRVTIAALEFVEDNSVSTAATDSKYVYYSKKFMDSLTNSEQLFVLAHEICHVALEHIPRLKNRKMEIWNIATDAIINAFLTKDGLTPPEGLIFINNALNYSSEELYQKLSKEMMDVMGDKRQASKKHERWNKESDSDSSSSGMKSDDDNNPADKKSSNGNGSKTDSKDDKEEGSLGNKGGNEDIVDEDEAIDEEDDNSIDEREIFEENEKIRKKEEEDFKRKINKGNMGYSPTSPFNPSPIKVNREFKKPRLIDWRIVLRENTRFELDYSYKNAEIEDGVVLSHLEEKNFCETEILLDTSGSVSSSLINRFLNECIHLLEFSKVRVGCFDTSFYGFQDIRTPEDFKNVVITGGGGTNFYTAASSFSKCADNKIIFTDGYGYYNGLDTSIVWVVFGNNCKLPNNLRIIKIKI